ncbi:MAG TPA: cytochrome b N-terminal domain-containing protein [Thermoplasmata archaeon]|nr:cytochrome b N-terminal domain-containing protein [Thermoplasmata archaeon]
MATDTRAKGPVERLVAWVDSRLGLSYPLLRPVPRYALNPFAWLGALTVVAFAILAITGIIMMLYYVPTPAAAYSSTAYVFSNVAYGRFIETVHLYTAYAMVLLMFAHMMRHFFVSVHKRPREVMWLVGMLMGGVTLGFAFTGYLLPWTVISKSATDVAVQIIGQLPPPLPPILTFLVVGPGGDAGELLRFYDLHVVVLPAALLVLLVVKMYMLEAHGISEPVTKRGRSPEKQETTPIFPDVTLYLLELAAVFGAGMLFLGAVFPLNLPPAYTPAAAAGYTPQPDWYFLWLYQILKISIFAAPPMTGIPALILSVVTLLFILPLSIWYFRKGNWILGFVALAAAFVMAAVVTILFAVTLLFLVLFLLPILDVDETRAIENRPVFVTVGAIFTAELAVLAYWGLITPGQDIPTWQGAAVIGGTAAVVGLASFLAFRFARTRRAAEAPA